MGRNSAWFFLPNRNCMKERRIQMAAKKKVGDLIKEARTNAGLTQAGLASKVGISASDIGKAERGEKELTKEQLKDVARATGVTQKSLLEAASGGTTANKTGTASKPAAVGTGEP